MISKVIMNSPVAVPYIAVMKIRSDGLVDLETRRGNGVRKHTTTLQDIYNSLSEDIPQTSPFLPPFCRQINVRGDIMSVVLEIPECKKRIQYVSRGINFREVCVLPWAIFIISFKKTGALYHREKSYVFSRPAPLQSIGDPLYNMPLHNVHSTGEICWGSIFFNSTISDSITEIKDCYKYVDLFFGSNFNNDLTPNHRDNFIDSDGKSVMLLNHFGFLQYLSTLDSFPYPLLTRHTTTIKALLHI